MFSLFLKFEEANAIGQFAKICAKTVVWVPWLRKLHCKYQISVLLNI